MNIRSFSIAVLLAISAPASASVYVGAHPDDIELFMNVNASRDVYHGERTVFILTTAGDAALKTGLGNNTNNTPYYRARLIAHERAIRYWVSLIGGTGIATTRQTMYVGGHQIERADIANVSIINLNLPDGAATDGRTLTGLINGQVSTISSIDGINTYTLEDLKNTIRQVIASTHHDLATVWVGFQNEDESVNTNDHPDHIATGRIVASALAGSSSFSCVNKARFLDYVVATLPDNETDAERLIHVGTWGALNSGLYDAGNQNTWDNVHNVWLGRQYVSAEMGGGNCSL